MNLVLAGTGDFSAKIFKSLIENENFNVVALISQPNNKLDRNKKPVLTDVARLANETNIPLYQPEKIKEIYEELKQLDFDFFITASFGQFIPNSILKLPKVLPVNVHGSLLEKYRGAAPIQYALLNDEKETGITLIEMVDKMDAGDILGIAKTQIKEDDTALEIFDKLANLSIENLPNWLTNIYQGNYSRIKQDETKVTFANKINKAEAELNQEMNCQKALNIIRAFNNQPGAYIFLNNKRLKIFRATKEKIKTPLKIEFKDGYLYLIEYQFEGKAKVKHEI
ncbi:methionyl-tRNA formyltransferase [[Mycoplasma] falconis]|uniref:methionyl-tRNA formyltransferase n=1 Tax=[Mycoplasma] falconis TaxID=92403 RepID=A0A501XBQ4_9BACT|nr:methionyl-tRNA formyltransferase [[Mycoplasma] falconis]